MNFKCRVFQETLHGLEVYRADVLLDGVVISSTTAFSSQAAVSQVTHMARKYERDQRIILASMQGANNATK